MAKIDDLEKEIKEIKERNKRVELDKKWETSWTRKIVIFVLTYIAISAYFYFAKLPDPLVNAVVPAVAFVISTLSLPVFRRIWEKKIYSK